MIMRVFLISVLLLMSALLHAQSNGRVLFPDQPDYAWLVDLLGEKSSREVEKEFFKRFPKSKEKIEFTTDRSGLRYREMAGEKKKSWKYSARIIINDDGEVVRVMITHISEMFDGVYAIQVLGANSESEQDSLIANHPEVYSSVRFENWYETDSGRIAFYFDESVHPKGLEYEANFMVRERDPYRGDYEAMCQWFDRGLAPPSVASPDIHQKGLCLSGCEDKSSSAILYFGTYAYVGEVNNDQPHGRGSVYELSNESCDDHIVILKDKSAVFTKQNLLFEGEFDRGIAEKMYFNGREDQYVVLNNGKPTTANNMPFQSEEYGWSGFFTGKVDSNFLPHDSAGEIVIKKKLRFLEGEPNTTVYLDNVDFNHGFYRHDYMRKYRVQLLHNMRWHGELTAYFDPKGEGTMFFFEEGDTVGYVGTFMNGYFQEDQPNKLTVALSSWDFDGIIQNYSDVDYVRSADLTFEGDEVYLYPRDQSNIRYVGAFNRLYFLKKIHSFPVGNHEKQQKRGSRWVTIEKASYSYYGVLQKGKDWYGISDELSKMRNVYWTANVSQPRMNSSDAKQLKDQVSFILRRLEEYPALLYGQEEQMDLGFPGSEISRVTRVNATCDFMGMKGVLVPIGKYSDYHRLIFLQNDIASLDELEYLQRVLVNEFYAILKDEWFLEAEDEDREKGFMTYRFTKSSPEKFGYCRGDCPEIVVQIFNGPRRDLMVVFKYPNE